MSFTVANHPLIAHRLAELRATQTSSPRFRMLVRELGALMITEVARTWPTKEISVSTPLIETTGHVLAEDCVIIPILRAGLSYAEGVEQFLPDAAIGHIGLCRDEVTHRPISYLTKLPDLTNKRVLLVDPMLATGYSAAKAAEVVISAGATPALVTLLTIVAAPEGRDVFANLFPSIAVWTASLDDHLNANAYIVPGLGDAGDRIYGTL